MSSGVAGRPWGRRGACTEPPALVASLDDLTPCPRASSATQAPGRRQQSRPYEGARGRPRRAGGRTPPPRRPRARVPRRRARTTRVSFTTSRSPGPGIGGWPGRGNGRGPQGHGKEAQSRREASRGTAGPWAMKRQVVFEVASQHLTPRRRDFHRKCCFRHSWRGDATAWSRVAMAPSTWRSMRASRREPRSGPGAGGPESPRLPEARDELGLLLEVGAFPGGHGVDLGGVGTEVAEVSPPASSPRAADLSACARARSRSKRSPMVWIRRRMAVCLGCV